MEKTMETTMSLALCPSGHQQVSGGCVSWGFRDIGYVSPSSSPFDSPLLEVHTPEIWDRGRNSLAPYSRNYSGLSGQAVQEFFPSWTSEG